MLTPFPPMLRSVAGYGLSAARVASEPPSMPGDDEWRRLVDEATEQRLLGVLAAAVADGWLPASDERAVEVMDAHEAAVVGCLLLDRTLAELSSAMTDAGIEHAAFKGAANALRLYPEPFWRTYGDVDLLVAGGQFEAAASVLLSLGATAQSTTAISAVARFGKSATFDMSGRVEIDLHRTFSLGPFGLVAGQRDLLARRDSITVAGRAIPVLDPAASMVAAASNAVLAWAECRLVPLRDLAQMVDIDWVEPEAVLLTAAEWGALPVLAAAIQLTSELFGLPRSDGLVRWAHEFRATRREQRWLRGYHDTRPDAYLRQLSDELLALPDLRSRVQYAYVTVAHPGAEPWRARARRLVATIRSG
jgi:hypothetical protein